MQCCISFLPGEEPVFKFLPRADSIAWWLPKHKKTQTNQTKKPQKCDNVMTLWNIRYSYAK